jgi:hypothetical protein
LFTIRFRNFPGEKSFGHFVELIEIATGQSVNVCQSMSKNVDLEITGPYHGNLDLHKTPLAKKLKRFGYVSITNGKHLSKRNLATGIQPNKTAKKNIWYSGENVRPPQGTWDGFLAFDTNLPKDRSVYFPLWFLTSTNLFKSTTETYWGSEVPTISELTEGRVFTSQRKKFVATFIGKSYSMRLHAIEALAKVGKVDVFGEAARNQVKIPSIVARNYKFVMCFENDLYPGYVTEKPLEAYLTGSIPLYFGIDNLGYLNPKAIINLYEFKNIIEWVDYIKKIENNSNLFKKIYEQPILLKKPTLNEAINLIQKVLEV